MGWWWNSPISKGPSQAEKLPSTDNSNPSQQTEGSEWPEPEQVKRTLTREEQSNQELIAWLKDIQAQSEERKTEVEPQNPSNTAPSHSSIREDISPDSIYPTEIHCRSAFDYAFFCQSFGGQFVNVYRYGSFRSCSNHWQDFWLCMRTRNWEGKERAKAVQDHYRKKAIKYKTGPSSEDVWKVRTEPVRDAFQGNLEELEKQIEEWRKANPNANNPWSKAT